jgi:hypothetical protein
MTDVKDADGAADSLMLGDGAAALPGIRERHLPAAESTEPRSGGNVTIVKG